MRSGKLSQSAVPAPVPLRLRTHQTRNEVSPPHGFPPLLERIVTFRAIEWQRRNAHGSYGSIAPNAARVLQQRMSVAPRLCSLIPGLGVKLSTIILAEPTVLSAVGACPPHDGVRRRWRTNVASAVVLLDARKKSDGLATATVPAGTTFPALSRDPCDLLMRATQQPSSSTS